MRPAAQREERESPHDFDRFVRFYELDHQDYREDIPLYLDLALDAGDPILELGCGTGRLLLPLAEAGHAITGVDTAPEMLAAARRKAEDAGLTQRITLVQADMRLLDMPARFRLAFCGLNTLMHLCSLEDQLRALQAARRHLVSGGVFAVDLTNPHVAWLTEDRTPLTLDKEIVDPITGHHILKLVSQRTDPAEQVSDITLIYDELEEDGAVRRTLVPVRLRWIYPYELRLLLELAGFRVDRLYGSYDLAPFATDSERLIAVAHVP